MNLCLRFTLLLNAFVYLALYPNIGQAQVFTGNQTIDMGLGAAVRQAEKEKEDAENRKYPPFKTVEEFVGFQDPSYEMVQLKDPKDFTYKGKYLLAFTEEESVAVAPDRAAAICNLNPVFSQVDKVISTHRMWSNEVISILPDGSETTFQIAGKFGRFYVPSTYGTFSLVRCKKPAAK